jgi:hypothetical protein
VVFAVGDLLQRAPDGRLELGSLRSEWQCEGLQLAGKVRAQLLGRLGECTVIANPIGASASHRQSGSRRWIRCRPAMTIAPVGVLMNVSRASGETPALRRSSNLLSTSYNWTGKRRPDPPPPGTADFEHLFFATEHLWIATEQLLFPTEQLFIATEQLFFSPEQLLFPTEQLLIATEHRFFPTEQLFIATEHQFFPTEQLLIATEQLLFPT